MLVSEVSLRVGLGLGELGLGEVHKLVEKDGPGGFLGVPSLKRGRGADLRGSLLVCRNEAGFPESRANLAARGERAVREKSRKETHWSLLSTRSSGLDSRNRTKAGVCGDRFSMHKGSNACADEVTRLSSTLKLAFDSRLSSE